MKQVIKVAGFVPKDCNPIKVSGANYPSARSGPQHSHTPPKLPTLPGISDSKPTLGILIMQ